MNHSSAALDELAKALSDVEGWLGQEEALALYEAARFAPSEGRPVTAAEIGSWKGRSAIALSLGLKARGGGKVFAIDPHSGSVEHIARYGVVDTYAEFMQNISRTGVRDLVEPIRRTSHAARSLFENESIHVLFVDGSHEYADVVTDITDYETALADRAIVAFHDVSWPGVRRALRENVARMKSPYRRPRFIGQMLIFDFHRGAAWTYWDTVAFVRLRLFLAVLPFAGSVRRRTPKWIVPLGQYAFRYLKGESFGRQGQ